MMRDFLRQASPTIGSLLWGQQQQEIANKIAEATGFNPQTVAHMLRGSRLEDYTEESMATVMKEASKVLREHAGALARKAEEIDHILSAVGQRA